MNFFINNFKPAIQQIFSPLFPHLISVLYKYLFASAALLDYCALSHSLLCNFSAVTEKILQVVLEKQQYSGEGAQKTQYVLSVGGVEDK